MAPASLRGENTNLSSSYSNIVERNCENQTVSGAAPMPVYETILERATISTIKVNMACNDLS